MRTWSIFQCHVSSMTPGSDIKFEWMDVSAFIGDHAYEEYYDVTVNDPDDPEQRDIELTCNKVIVLCSSGPDRHFEASVFVDKSGPVWILHYLRVRDPKRWDELASAIISKVMHDAVNQGVIFLLLACRLADPRAEKVERYRKLGFIPVSASAVPRECASCASKRLALTI